LTWVHIYLLIYEVIVAGNQLSVLIFDKVITKIKRFHFLWFTVYYAASANEYRN